MVSESRIAESTSAVEMLIQEIRQFGSQASPVTAEDILSVQSDVAALPGDQVHAAQTIKPSSGLVNRVHKRQPAARSLPQPESNCLLQDAEQSNTLPSAFTTNSNTPQRSILTKVLLRLSYQKAWRNIPTCYSLIAFGLLTIIGSLFPAMWRSIHSNDVSGGFTLAQYILGVGVFVIGCVVAIHSRKCTCWSSSQVPGKARASDGDNTAELHSINPSETEFTRSFRLEV